jgi:hypothetical protein
MPNTYIKDSGDWELVQRPWVKDGGSWKPVKKIWIKTDQIVTNTSVTGGEILSTVSGADSGWFDQSYPPGWGTFMNTYAIDTNGSLNSAKTFNATVNFPADGNYEFKLQIDDFGTLSLDDSIILTIPAAYGASAWLQNIDTFGYGMTDMTNDIGFSTIRYVTAGSHKISISMGDRGNICGLACQILSVNTPLPSTEIWNTRKAISEPTQYAYSPIVSNSVSEKKSVWKQVFGNTGTRRFNVSNKNRFTVGGQYNYKVPEGVTSMTFDTIGAGGSGGDGSSVGGSPRGGYAGTVASSTISVTPGEILTFNVGIGGAPVAYGSGLTGKSGTATTIYRGNTLLLSAASGAGGGRTGGGGTGTDSASPFKGKGGTFTWGGQGGSGTLGSGGGGVDGHASGKTSGTGGDGAIVITAGAETTFKVPPGVYSIDVSYPDGDGRITTTKLNVTPKDVINVVIGDDGQDSSFGSITIPYRNYNQQVIHHKGYVDKIFSQTINIATPTGEAYGSAPYLGNVYPTAGRDDAATIASQAAKKGINIITNVENSLGDLAQEIVVTPIMNDGTLPPQLTATTLKETGRGIIYIVQQPTAKNGYKVKIEANNTLIADENLYEYNVYVQTPPYISISY